MYQNYINVHLLNLSAMVSNDTNEDDYLANQQPYTIILVSLSASIICILNTSIVVTMMSGKCIGKPILNIHIVSLSISDLLIGLNLAPMYVARTAKDPPYMMCFCIVTSYLFFFTVSTFHVCLICLDRCWLLGRRLPSSLGQAKFRFRLVVGMSWLASFIIIIIPLVTYRNNRPIEECSMRELVPGNYQQVMRYFAVIYMVSIIVISGCSVWVIRFLLSQRKTRRIGPFGRTSPPRNIQLSTISGQQARGAVANHNRPPAPRLPTGHVTAAWTIAVLGTLFSAFLAPMTFSFIFDGWINDYSRFTSIRSTGLYIASLHSAFNPIIYSMRIPEVITNLNAWKRRCFRSQ